MLPTRHLQLRLSPIERALVAAGLGAIDETPPAWLASGIEECLAAPRLWRRLVRASVEQKLLPHLVEQVEAASRLHPAVADGMELLRLATGGLFDYLMAVTRRLGSRIPILVIKGGDLLLTCYRAGITRQMRDLDLVVRPHDVDAVLAAFAAEGFIAGEFEESERRVVPMAARVNEYLRRHHYEVAPVRRAFEVPSLAGRGRGVALADLFGTAIDLVEHRGRLLFAFEYDIHFNLSLEMDLSDVWYRTETIDVGGGERVRVQAPSEKFWFLASRLYHEAAMGDATIRQLIDVLAVAKTHAHRIDWQRVLDVAKRYGLQPSIFFVGWHVNEILGAEVVPSHVLARCDPGRRKARLAHDWGDFLPRLFRRTLLSPLQPASSR